MSLIKTNSPTRRNLYLEIGHVGGLEGLSIHCTHFFPPTKMFVEPTPASISHQESLVLVGFKRRNFGSIWIVWACDSCWLQLQSFNAYFSSHSHGSCRWVPPRLLSEKRGSFSISIFPCELNLPIFNGFCCEFQRAYLVEGWWSLSIHGCLIPNPTAARPFDKSQILTRQFWYVWVRDLLPKISSEHFVCNFCSTKTISSTTAFKKRHGKHQIFAFVNCITFLDMILGLRFAG